MKITRSKLRKIISKERQRMLEATGLPDIPTDIEAEMAAALNLFFQDALTSPPPEGSYESWPEEVQEAAAAYEQALIDSGVLESLIQLFDAVEASLHNGNFATGSDPRDSDGDGHVDWNEMPPAVKANGG
tara:strand:+ start:230 stop:619 length:390 start_codon:yes stop_codon:yes gene_type:complete